MPWSMVNSWVVVFDLTTGNKNCHWPTGQGSKLEPESQKRDPESRLNGWAEMGASLSAAELRWNCHRFWTALYRLTKRYKS